MSSEKLKTHFTTAAVGRGSIKNSLRFGKNSPVRIRQQALGRAIDGAQHSLSPARAVVSNVLTEVSSRSHQGCFS